jgi:predicted lipoprotein with Yx(FWY)xxD motif
MTKHRRVVALLLSLAVFAAACSGDDGDGAVDATTPQHTPTLSNQAATGAAVAADNTRIAAPAPADAPTVAAAEVAGVGSILVTNDGYALYTIAADVAGSGVSSCATRSCLAVWPPFHVTAPPTAGDGVTGALTTFKQLDGLMQVAYNGRPLYRFRTDVAGEARGEGVGDRAVARP